MLKNIVLHWRHLMLQLFVVLGGTWTILEFLISATNFDPKNYSAAYVSIVILFSLIVALFLVWRRVRSTEFTLRGTNTRIRISFGDVFGSTSSLVIPANTNFDHELQEENGPAMPVSVKSVHGQLVQHVGAASFRERVDSALSGVKPVSTDSQRKLRPHEAYALGTVAQISSETQKFYLVALTQTDPETWKARTKLTEVFSALTAAWRTIGQINDQEPLIMPLIGSGFANLRIDPEHLLDILIASIVESTFQDGCIANEIEIMLPKSKIGEIRCYNVANEWS
ncbi:MAG: macro domain-containing protein [Pseudomonadota bacterium]